VLLLASPVYADIDYNTLKNDLVENSSTLELLDLNVLKMNVDVYKAELESKSANSTLE
jgi:hypothetical protein